MFRDNYLRFLNFLGLGDFKDIGEKFIKEQDQEKEAPELLVSPEQSEYIERTWKVKTDQCIGKSLGLKMSTVRRHRREVLKLYKGQRVGKIKKAKSERMPFDWV